MTGSDGWHGMRASGSLYKANEAINEDDRFAFELVYEQTSYALDRGRMARDQSADTIAAAALSALSQPM